MRGLINTNKLYSRLNAVTAEEKKRARHKKIQVQFKKDYAQFMLNKKIESKRMKTANNQKQHVETLKKIAEIVGINTKEWKH